jgi:hypothetical protein
MAHQIGFASVKEECNSSFGKMMICTLNIQVLVLLYVVLYNWQARDEIVF